MRYTVFVWKQHGGGDLPAQRGLSAKRACEIIREYFRGNDGKVYVDNFKDSKYRQVTCQDAFNSLIVIVVQDKIAGRNVTLADLEGDW